MLSFCIITIILLIAALIPILLTGQEFAVNFRFMILPLLLFIAVLLVCICVFFFLNYRLFSLLEREDWPALAYYLEQKVYVKKRYNTRNVRLLASSYLVMSDHKSVLTLESKVRSAKSSLISENVLIFGAARILSGSHAEAADFFKTYITKCKEAEKQWVSWFYGFSQLLAGAINAAESEFASLAVSSNNALITGLCAYFLGTNIGKKSVNPEKCMEISENGKERVVKVLKNAEGWKKEVNKSETDIHVAIIKKYIDEAGIWLFV